MAKITDRPFHFSNNSGANLDFVSKISVNTKGIFSVTIPEELQKIRESR